MGLGDMLSGVLGDGDAMQKASGLLEQFGGLDGLVGKLQESGLGDQVGSWIGTGDNKDVSPDQLRNALGDDNLQKAGFDPSDLGGLAKMLPQAIDGLTPDGKLPAADQVQDLLGRFLGK